MSFAALEAALNAVPEAASNAVPVAAPLAVPLDLTPVAPWTVPFVNSAAAQLAHPERVAAERPALHGNSAVVALFARAVELGDSLAVARIEVIAVHAALPSHHVLSNELPVWVPSWA